MRSNTLWLILAIASLTVSVLTCGGGALVLALSVVGGASQGVTSVLPLAGVLVLSVGLGVLLTVHGWAGWRGRPSRPFNPAHPWLPWLLPPLLVGAGYLVVTLHAATAILLPPIHVLTMTLWPLAILWLVGWALRGKAGSWREVTASLAGASSVGFGAAFVAEVFVVLVLVTAATVGVLLLPGGPERVSALARELPGIAERQDITALLKLLLSPAFALSLLLTFSVPVPLIEETFKTLIAGLAGRWVRPSPARAFLWGVAGGAGFALVENLLGGSMSGTEEWAIGAVSRMGATAMHCFTGGLVGWGWGQLWATRRPWRLLGSYIVAVLVHGTWNGIAVGMVLVGISALAYGENVLWTILAGLAVVLLMGTLGLLTVVFLAALAAGGRTLANREPQPEPEPPTPLGDVQF